MQRGWVGDVADLFFFSLQKDYSINIDEVGTNHPIFSFFSAVPVFVIVCSTMVLPASCLMGSPVRRGQLRDILRREPASCPACHFREIWYWGSTWWCTCQNRFWVYPWASLSMRLQWCLASWDAVCSACSIYEHDGNIDFLSEWQLSSMTRMVLSASWRTEICASWSSCSLCWSRCS